MTLLPTEGTTPTGIPLRKFPRHPEIPYPKIGHQIAELALFSLDSCLGKIAFVQTTCGKPTRSAWPYGAAIPE
jgi:hypothetical protein